MKKVLVTGGLGYIGSHTVVSLQEAGFEVIIIDDLSNSSKEVLIGIFNITGIRPSFEKLNLRNKVDVREFFKRNSDIVGIIHFAASKAVGESVTNPLHYYDNNLNSLIHILQGCVEHEIHDVIFSSSCTVYGEPDTLPITENARIKKAISPYGNTKQICEEIIFDTCLSTTDFKAISLRYFNPIGAHHTAEIGELPIGVPQNLVPFITQTAAGIRKELFVFGDDYPTPDGSCIRDYIHVVDLAEAHVIALQRLLSKKNTSKYEVFNLGTGKGTSVFDVIHAFEKVTNRKLNYKISERRPGDVASVYADTVKAQNELGWSTKRSIEDSLASAWKWEQKIRNL